MAHPSVTLRFIVGRNTSDLYQYLTIAFPISRKLADVIGVIPDHDDKVAQDALSTAYDETAAAWKVGIRLSSATSL